MSRELTHGERELLSWVLPEDREGYRAMRELVLGLNVTAQGRRGEGHLILAPEGTDIDHDSPLPQVFALGVVEHDSGGTSVLVREPLGPQVDVEITGTSGRSEKRRWTLSSWKPSDACPQCAGPVREVSGKTQNGNLIALAICQRDQRLWVFDSVSGVNHPVPVTLYYSELMRATRTREPSVALDASRLFTATAQFRDDDLLRAFSAYNDIRAKVSTKDRLVLPGRPKGFFQWLFSSFGRKL